jgi:hypothetical protein
MTLTGLGGEPFAARLSKVDSIFFDDRRAGRFLANVAKVAIAKAAIFR